MDDDREGGAGRMDDQELRGRLDDVQEDVKELRKMLTGMQVADAQARGDLKVVVGKLDNAADALARAAQTFHASDLARTVASEAGEAKATVVASWKKDPLGIAVAAIVIVVGIIALGERAPEIIANIFAAVRGN
jgi:hypothetical protein